MPGDGEEHEVQKNYVQTPVRKFTWQELSRLNKRHNAHIAYRGKVYDVSGFVSRHPGGADQIMLGAGKDITQVFESYHRLDVAKVMDKYYVGELVSYELPVFPRPGKFSKTLKERVDRFFKENNIDPKIDYWMFLRYFLFIAFAFVCWGGILCFHSSWIIGVMLALGWGAFSALISLTFIHDASHFAITHKPWVWKMMGFIHDCYQGTSFLTWSNQHVMGHHPYTNIHGADPDVHAASDNTPDFWRVRWEQKWVPRYLYQHIYAPSLYCLLLFKSRFQDFLIIFTRRHNVIRVNDPTPSQWIMFVTGKVTYCVIRFCIPYLFMPLSTLMLYNLMMELVSSYWLAFMFAPSHMLSEVEWPKPDENNMIDKDWAEMQVGTTLDYATESWFWNLVTGALNHQTAHHLFPGVIQSHYPKITPIVKQTCEEFGIKYHYVETFKQAVDCHVRHLHRMGHVETEEQEKKGK